MFGGGRNRNFKIGVAPSIPIGLYLEMFSEQRCENETYWKGGDFPLHSCVAMTPGFHRRLLMFGGRRNRKFKIGVAPSIPIGLYLERFSEPRCDTQPFLQAVRLLLSSCFAFSAGFHWSWSVFGGCLM